jgi:2Fe-2S ferredoxin
VIKVTFIQPDGRVEIMEGTGHTSVMQVAVSSGLAGIVGECGGNLSCATCHVFVDEQWINALPKPTAAELDMLEGTAVETTQASRLSCQIKLCPALNGLIVHIPSTQR